MRKKLVRCSQCGKSGFVLVGGNKISTIEFEKLEGILKVLNSHKDAYEKKIALFNWLKKIEVGEIEVTEKQRINCLLQGKLYNELAKQKMREYKKLTIEDFSKVK